MRFSLRPWPGRVLHCLLGAGPPLLVTAGGCWGCSRLRRRRPLVEEYDGRQVVGIDLHRRRSVIVRMTPEGQRLGPMVRIDNDPLELARQVALWGESPQVVLE